MKIQFLNFLKSNLIKLSKYLVYFGLFVLVNVCLKMFVIDVFHVTGSSMNPTLLNGNYVVIYKYCKGIRLPRNVFEVPWIGTLAYYCTSNSYINQVLDSSKGKMFNRLGDFLPIKRGDIIVFNNPMVQSNFVIKRCVALPGDSIANYMGETHSPWITPFPIVPYKGMRVPEKILNEMETKLIKKNRAFQYIENDSSYVAKCDCYFVLGDNIHYSEDSRHFGVVSEDLIVGKMGWIIR